MLGVLTCAVVVSLPALCAGAEPDEQTRFKARELVYEGDELFAQRHFAEALRAYESAERLVRVPTTSIEVAKTLAAIGRLTEAREIAAAIASPRALAGEPWPFTQARRRAAALQAELDERIPRLRITLVPSPPSSRFKIDGQAVAPSSAGLAIDPGNHWVEVEAAGYQRARQRVYVPERKVTDLHVSLTPEPRAPGVSPWVLGGFLASGAGLVTGIAAGAAYLDQRDNLEDACRRREPERCSAGARSDTSALGWVSNVGFGVAIVGAAVGGIALGLESEQTSSSSVALTIGPGTIGLRGAL
jgi:hypothetical protein